MAIGLKVISKKKKSGRQEVTAVFVLKEKGEFVFSYNTSKEPGADDMELLQTFRNRFVEELKKMNSSLCHVLPDSWPEERVLGDN